MKALLTLRACMGRDVEYAVHLRDADEEQPIHTRTIDYYDTGVWVHVEEGRDFYPWDRIAVIREREVASEAPDSATRREDEDVDRAYVDLEGTIDGTDSEPDGEADTDDSAAVTESGSKDSALDPDED